MRRPRRRPGAPGPSGSSTRSLRVAGLRRRARPIRKPRQKTSSRRGTHNRDGWRPPLPAPRRSSTASIERYDAEAEAGPILHRPVRLGHVRRAAVGVRVHSHGAQADLPGCPDYPERHFTAVGDKQRVDGRPVTRYWSSDFQILGITSGTRRNASARVGGGRGRQRQAHGQHAAGLQRVDHPVVPEASRRVVGRTL